MVGVLRGVVSFVIIGMVVVGGQMLRAEDQSAAASPQHVLVTPDDLTWQDGPASLPAGSQSLSSVQCGAASDWHSLSAQLSCGRQAPSSQTRPALHRPFT